MNKNIKNDKKAMFEDIVKKFLNKKCTILTTYEEYEKNTEKYKKFNIIASCGHVVNDVYKHTFFNRNSGERCKDCVKKDTAHILKSKPLTPFDTQYLSENLLKKSLPDFIVEKTVEGCLVDIIIKPKNLKNNNLYLPIQLKATLEKNFNCYSFGKITKDKYANMVIVFICISEKLFWVLENKDIDTKIKINIGATSKKYGKFQVDITKLNDTFKRIYNDNINILNTKEYFNIPINIYQQREYEYRKIREESLKFINFIIPLVDGQVYDFLINNKKVQEKVCGIRKGRNQYLCQLSKNTTRENNKRKHINYELGDNDFYWINLPDKNTFYIFPEKILYDMNKIDMNNLATLTIPYNDTNLWCNKYKFSYNNPDKEKIEAILCKEYIIKNKLISEKIIYTDENILLDKLNKLY